MATPPTIFISYSRQDEPWKDRLVEHLGVLVSRGLLDVWDDSRIMAGATWRSEIEQAIDRASVARPLHISSATESAISMCLARQIDPRRTADVLVALLSIAKVDVSPPAIVAPFNLGFEGPLVDGMPLGSFNSVGYVSGVSNACSVGVVERAGRPY